MPISFKKYIGIKLQQFLLTHQPHLILGDHAGDLPVAGQPGTPNPWWHELEKKANGQLFGQVISKEAKEACAAIRESYRPLLQHYDVDFEEFFWGSIKNEEAEALYQLILERKPLLCYQVGTFVGYSALIIAHALRANGQGKLIAVDPEIPHRTLINPVDIAKHAAKQQDLSEYIQFVRGWHSVTSGDYVSKGFKKSIPVVGIDVLKRLENEVDFVFIDGDHSTSCTMTDFLIMKDYLSKGSLTLFHDAYSWPTVAQAINILLHDIYYYVNGTQAYFSMDTRRGDDGLIALERVNHELFPMTKLMIVNGENNPIANAKVVIPELDVDKITSYEGSIYLFNHVPNDMVFEISHTDYQSFRGKVTSDIDGDFDQRIICLSQ